MYANAGVYTPPHVCRGERATWVFVLAFHLVWNRVSLSAAVYPKLVGLGFWKFCCFYLPSHPRNPVIMGMSFHAWLCVGSGDSNSSNLGPTLTQ